MAKRLSRSAPYEVHSLDVHSINDVFRQIQAAIDELKGLAGEIHLFDSVNIDGDLTVAGDTNITGALTVSNVTFSSTSVITGLDASDVTYTPAVLADWGSDPGNVDDALDFLIANTGSSASTDLIDADTTPWEELVSDSLGGGSMRIQSAAGGNAAELRALQPITVGDSLIGELQLLDDGTNALIYA